MRNFFMIALIPIFLTACATEGIYSKYNTFTAQDGCDDDGTFVKIHYGDSYLEVKPKVHLKKGSSWEFRLMPRTNSKLDKFDYKKMQVTIKGKSDDTANSWIDVKGTFNESRNGSLILCVNPKQTEDVKTYEYMVEVENVGTLDPRAEVKR